MLPEGYENVSRTFEGYENQVFTKLKCVFRDFFRFYPMNFKTKPYNVKEQMSFSI